MSDNETQRLTCTGTTRSGNPCSAFVLKGRDVCLAHADPETRASTGFIANNGKGGRPPNPRAVDVLRERVEAEIDRVITPLFDALEAERNWTDDTGSHVTPDHGLRLAAVRELLDRVYGKPKQTQELTGPAGGPILLSTPDDAEARAQRAAQILERARLTLVEDTGATGS